MPVYRTLTSAGVEIRNYVNSQEVAQCFSSVGATHGRGAHVSHTAFATCSENRVVCNNLFYIQAGKVVRYAPTGNCYTDDSVRPQGAVKSHGLRPGRKVLLATGPRA